MSDAAERSNGMKIWNLTLNLVAVRVIGDFDRNSFSGMVGLR